MRSRVDDGIATRGIGLPGTTRWEFPADIVADQYRELRDFYERQHHDAAGEREQFGRSSVED